MTFLATVKRFEKEREKRLAATAYERIPNNIYDAIGYSPREWQAEMEANERRFNVEVIHRRAGKSVAKVAKLIDRAVECPFPDGRYAYFAPTYSQAEDIAWHYLTAFGEKIEGHNLVQSKLALFVPTRAGSVARIRLYGLDSPKQRVRGLYLDGAVFDEFAWIPPSAWTEQVRPMLTDENRAGVDDLGRENQWADFIFTPFGRNHAYTLFRNAQTWEAGGAVKVYDPVTDETSEVERNDYTALILPASKSGVLDAAELALAKTDMGRSKYEQEYECSFDAAVEGAIYARELEELKDRERIRKVSYNKLVPVNTAWDLGIDDATAIWFFQQVGDEVRLIDYYEASGAGLDHYADVLAQKRYRYGYHLLPHDVEVRDLGSGKSRRAVLEELGVRVSAVRKHTVWDGIAAAQSLLPRCVFDAENCADGLDRLHLYRRDWDEKLQRHKENPIHDWASHGADAFRYLAVGLKNSRARGIGRPSSGEF